MKIIPNATIYKCEFCSKKLFRQHAMVNHEKWCHHNPENTKACQDCRFLEETTVSYITESTVLGFDVKKESKAFKCTFWNKLMYPMKVEKKGLPKKYPETFKDQVPMPNECEYSESKYSFLID